MTNHHQIEVKALRHLPTDLGSVRVIKQTVNLIISAIEKECDIDESPYDCLVIPTDNLTEEVVSYLVQVEEEIGVSVIVADECPWGSIGIGISEYLTKTLPEWNLTQADFGEQDYRVNYEALLETLPEEEEDIELQLLDDEEAESLVSSYRIGDVPMSRMYDTIEPVINDDKEVSKAYRKCDIYGHEIIAKGKSGKLDLFLSLCSAIGISLRNLHDKKQVPFWIALSNRESKEVDEVAALLKADPVYLKSNNSFIRVAGRKDNGGLEFLSYFLLAGHDVEIKRVSFLKPQEYGLSMDSR